MDSLRAARTSGDLEFPDGNFELQAVGLFQNQIEANRRLMWIVPLVLLINLLLIYFAFRNLSIALVVFSGIPVAFAGGMIALAVTGVEVNTAVWVGFIALFGIAVDDGVVMATYIKQSLEKVKIDNVDKLREAIYAAGLKRIRPCVMTTLTTLIALLPIMLSRGRGSDVAQAMALPVFGGMLVEPFTTFIVPTLYCAYLELKLRLGARDQLLMASRPDPPEPEAPLAHAGG
jgi:Cu(I)/Ag(I) efflux system membrane protein CusA/SilA